MRLGLARVAGWVWGGAMARWSEMAEARSIGGYAGKEFFWISCQAQEEAIEGFQAEDRHSLIYLFSKNKLLWLPNRESGGGAREVLQLYRKEKLVPCTRQGGEKEGNGSGHM